jgi:hypothetical protein
MNLKLVQSAHRRSHLRRRVTDKKRHAFEPCGDDDWGLALDDTAKSIPSPGTRDLNK